MNPRKCKRLVCVAIAPLYLYFFGFEGGNRKTARASLVEHTRIVKVLHFLNFVCQNIAVLSLNYDLYFLTVVVKTIPTN